MKKLPANYMTRMMKIGADLLLQTINKLAENKLKEIPQTTSTYSSATLNTRHHAPKISTETCEIKWQKNVDEVYNLIRGLIALPCGIYFLNGKN